MGFEWRKLRKDREYRASLTSQVEEDEKLREEGRLICKTNLLALCWVLGYTKIDPEIHDEVLGFFLPRNLTKSVEEQGFGQLPKGTCLYPRGTFKTTIDEADSVQEIICFPLTATIFFLCANSKLADALVNNVALHFWKPKDASPTLFQALFPELCVGGQKDKLIKENGFTVGLRQQNPPIKEGHVMGFSNEAGNSGWHCWRLKCDDLANNRNMKTETSQREAYRNYTINRKMLMPGGIEDRLGTRYSPFDPYGMELANSRPGTYRYVCKPVLRLKDGGRLEPNGFPDREEIDLLFEGLGLTYDYLRDEYEADYASFMTQLMNDAAGANEVVFPVEQMNRMTRDGEDMPLDGDVSIAWRMPSKGHGFHSAAAAAGVMENGRMFIIDALHGVFRPSKLAMKVVQLAKKHGATRIDIEDTPGARHLEPAIQNYALTLGWPLHINWTPFEEAGIRDQRIKALEPKLAASRVIFSKELAIAKKLNEQFTTYGMVDDNSLPDVVSRICSKLPDSIALQSEEADDDLAWEMMKQHDIYNRLHGAGPYAAPEPEEAPEEEVDFGDSVQPNPWGLEETMPGLMG
jgi:hypothetical protein